MKTGSVRPGPFASCDQLRKCIAPARPPTTIADDLSGRRLVRQLLVVLTVGGTHPQWSALSVCDLTGWDARRSLAGWSAGY